MNLGLEFGFDRPWFLLLLLLLPPMWWLSFNSLAGLGRYRRVLALLLRTLVVSLLVLALAQTQWRQSTDRLTVIYLLDQSESIPSERREFMLNYVHAAVKEQRRKNKKDMAGVIIFGGNAKIESAPFDGELPLIDKVESGYDLKSGKTSLESALKLAKASFPEDTARRVVMISDGNENMGDALSLAQSMTDDGIGIDVLPVELIAESEVAVEKVVLPTEIRKGQEFEARVVINNDTEPSENNPTGQVTGTLRLVQQTAQNTQQVAEQVITLDPGKNIRGFKHKIDKSAVFTFKATFVPHESQQDLIRQNNEASAFSHVRGKGKVLLIEDAIEQGEFLDLVDILRTNSIEVDVMPSNELFTSGAELLQYDSVILANVARATGDTVESSVSFTDEQILALVNNCKEMGCGLVMLGGDRSFGAGGWANTELEKAMPVDFQIKNDKVSAVGALVMIMHACEIPNSNHWQTVIAREAIKIMGPMDYCGVVAWGDMTGVPRWLWKLPTGVDRVFNNRKRMMGLVGRMHVGDMPDFNAPMKLALQGFKNLPAPGASMKHMIIISDGDPTPPTAALIRGFINEGVQISTVACGLHMQMNNPLKKIASDTGGKYYAVKNAKFLPKIFQREARRVAKPVLKENPAGMSLVSTPLTATHEIMQGITPNTMPPFTGYVMTTIKKNPLVEQILLASDPANDKGENSTILASWRLGAVGRATAFTTDGGYKWTQEWLGDEQFGKLMVQIVRHSMRPITQNANFTVATDVRDNRLRVVVTAMDEDDTLINFLETSGRGVGPDNSSFDLDFSQVGPGRYVSEKDIEESGNYLFSIFPGEGYERLTAGVNVPYSSEYSDRESDLALLSSLAEFKPNGGESGAVIEGDLEASKLEQLLATNTFRPTLTHAVSIQDVWPLLLMICGLAFFADVFIRRVAIDFTPVKTYFVNLRDRLRGKENKELTSSMARLQSRKAEVEKNIQSRRAATRFEPEVDERASGKERLDAIIGSEIDKTPERAKKIERDEFEGDRDETYTSRLLDAKRKAQKKQDRGKIDPDKE